MDDIVLKCIAHAERIPTSDSDLNEANAAAVKAFVLMRKKGIRLTEVLTGSQPSRSSASNADLLYQNMQLESQNQTLKRNVSDLETKIAALKDRITKLNEKAKEKAKPRRMAVKAAPPEPKVRDGECSFREFAKFALAAFNHKAGWVTAFSKVAGVNRATIQEWREKGVVPSDMLKHVDELRTYGDGGASEYSLGGYAPKPL